MGDQGYTYTLDEAIYTIGFGNFQHIGLAYAGLGWVAEAMEMMLLSFVGPAIQPEWGLSSVRFLWKKGAGIWNSNGGFTCMVIMPSYGWRRLLGLSAVPYLAALLFYGLVPESPRYLCTQGRLAEALWKKELYLTKKNFR
ncbi:organic cation/carnitine transporter 7 isoform X2 [Tanacetum coccineum]